MLGVHTLPNAGVLTAYVPDPLVPALSHHCRRASPPFHDRHNTAPALPTTKAVPVAIVKRMQEHDVRDVVVVLGCSDPIEVNRL